MIALTRRFERQGGGGQVRRVVEIVAATALVLALSFAIARAAPSPIRIAAPDLGSQVMLRLFGETSDSNASFAAAQGDRVSESPFHELALQVHPAGAAPYLAAGAAQPFAQDRLTLRDLNAASSDVGFSPVTLSQDDMIAFVPSSTAFAAPYQPAAPSISPAPGTLAFASPVTPSGGNQSAAGATRAAFVPTTSQIGAVHFEGHDDSATVQTPQLNLNETSSGNGSDFNLRAGNRNLNVNLSSAYSQVTGGNDFSASTLNAAAVQLPGSVPLVVPSGNGANGLSVGAGVAVPVIHGLTLNLNYAAERLYNGYGLPGLVNLDAVNNSYGGRLTFNLPDTSSFLSISAYQDRFNDSLLPINGSTQTREDVNFTVKF
jgi:hypothetical protein